MSRPKSGHRRLLHRPLELLLQSRKLALQIDVQLARNDDAIPRLPSHAQVGFAPKPPAQRRRERRVAFFGTASTEPAARDRVQRAFIRCRGGNDLPRGIPQVALVAFSINSGGAP